MNDIIIIGFGISTICFILYLIDNNLLINFKNILILEKENNICKNSLNYKNVNSNSSLGSMLSIFKNKIFENELKKIKNDYDFDSYINLNIFNKILKNFTNIILKYIDNIDNLNVKFNILVDNIQHNDNHVCINNKYFGKILIIAAGGEQNLNFYKKKDVDNILNNEKKIILSKDFFNYNSLNFLNNKKILISGSSHSCISILDAILKNKINYKSIILYTKKKFKIFYKNKEECINNNDKYNKDDMCSETGFINRYDGLRENSKKIFLELNSYKNIIIKNNLSDINLFDIDYIIPCWGYYKILPKINNKLYIFNIDSNNNFNLKINKNIYNKIFLLGLSSNPKIKITQKNFNKSIDGIWLYYNVISDNLYQNLINSNIL